jgi:hypothetical protein
VPLMDLDSGGFGAWLKKIFGQKNR